MTQTIGCVIARLLILARMAALSAALSGAAFAAGPAAAQDARPPASAAEMQLSFAPVVKRAAPAVVNIYARRMAPRAASPFVGDPFFERFFQGLMPRGRSVQNSLGSGVILKPDGLVVSNHHVVGGAEEIRVVLADRREFDAEILLSDPESDLAVLRLEGADGLPHLELRGAAGLEVGDLVLAIGNPFGVGQTVTSGIVSALARSRTAPGGGAGYFIQTDAPINPGNSGGALVDMEGRLIGVNTAIVSRSGGSDGIGLAVPADLVRQVVAQAEAGRSTLARPWSGIAGQPVTGALAEAMGLETPMGLVIAEVHPASPFVLAGLQRGDVLLRLEGEPVAAPAELEFRLASLGIGQDAAVEFLRDGEARTASVQLIAPPEDPPRDERVLGPDTPFPGMRIANLNPALADELGAPLSAAGVAVIDPGLAARVGFRRGDVLLSLNGEAAPNARAFEALAAAGLRAVSVEIVRGGRRGALRFRL